MSDLFITVTYWLPPPADTPKHGAPFDDTLRNKRKKRRKPIRPNPCFASFAPREPKTTDARLRRRCFTERGAIATVSMTGHDLTQVSLTTEFVGIIVCETCGNKRCPHATDHRHQCTNSNAPGQPGSIYG